MLATSNATDPVRPARSKRRDELVAIAADLFAARGFANVTVDDIGAAAGVSGPALYHHFEGKEAILGEMLVRISDHLLTEGRALREAGRDDGDGDGDGDDGLLDGLIAMHVDFAVDQRALITVHFHDLLHASDADQRRVRQLQRQYVEIWVSALIERHPRLTPAEARPAVHATFGLINSTPFSSRVRRADMVDLLRRMAVGAITAVAPAN